MDMQHVILIDIYSDNVQYMELVSQNYNCTQMSITIEKVLSHSHSVLSGHMEVIHIVYRENDWLRISHGYWYAKS